MKKANVLVLAIIGFVFVGAMKVNAEEKIVTTKEELINCLTEGTGDTCKIGNNIDGITEKITISKNVTIDLNGREITFNLDTYAIEIVENKEVTIKDSSEEKTGLLKNISIVTNSGGIMIIEGIINLQSGSIEGSTHAIKVGGSDANIETTATLNMNGGFIKGKRTGIGLFNAKSKVYINDGEVNGARDNGIFLEGGNLYINGGLIDSENGQGIVVNNSNTELSINNGDIKGFDVALLFNIKNTFSLKGGDFMTAGGDLSIGAICIAGGTTESKLLPLGYSFYIDKQLISVMDGAGVCTAKNVRVVKNEYSINTSVANGKGTIKESFNINYGEDAEITFKPEDGYELEKVLVNNIDLTKEVKDGKLTIKEVFSDYDINVYYSLIEKEKQNNTETTIKKTETIENPKTIDSIIIYFMITIISIVGIISVFAYKKRYN